MSQNQIKVLVEKIAKMTWGFHDLRKVDGNTVIRNDGHWFVAGVKLYVYDDFSWELA